MESRFGDIVDIVGRLLIACLGMLVLVFLVRVLVFYSFYREIDAQYTCVNVVDKSEKVENVLFRMFFLNAAMYSYICIGLSLLIGEFVTKYWLNGEYFLKNIIIVFTILELFLRSIHYPIYTVRNAYGLFSQYKIIFLISAMLNILLDFLLVKPLGITGLIISTIFCRGICYLTDIYVVYKFGFNKVPNKYFYRLSQFLIKSITIKSFNIISYIILSL